MEYVTLLGAEEVANAGRSISSSADVIMRAANSFSESVSILARSMERLEEEVRRMNDRVDEFDREEVARMKSAMEKPFTVYMEGMSSELEAFMWQMLERIQKRTDDDV